MINDPDSTASILTHETLTGEIEIFSTTYYIIYSVPNKSRKKSSRSINAKVKGK